MCAYVEFVADRLLVALSCEKIYRTANPFDWMEGISLTNKANFFESKVSQYQKAGVMNRWTKESKSQSGWDGGDHAFSTDADF